MRLVVSNIFAELFSITIICQNYEVIIGLTLLLKFIPLDVKLKNKGLTQLVEKFDESVSDSRVNAQNSKIII